jgi:hypothetical protein
MEQSVEHRGGDHRIVEDLAPRGDAEIGREYRRALQVPRRDHLDQRRSSL